MAFNKNSIILLDSICTFKASLQPVLSRNTQFVSCLSKFHRATAFLKPPVKALMLKIPRGTLTPATACASGSSSILGVKLYGKQPHDAECSSLRKMCRAPQYCIDDFLSLYWWFPIISSNPEAGFFCSEALRGEGAELFQKACRN